VRFEVFEGAGQFLGNGFAVARGSEIARDARYPNDSALAITHRQLGGQAPAGSPSRIPVQFQVVNDRPAGAQYGLILGCIELRQVLWKNVTDVAPDQLSLVLQTASFNERLIHSQVAALRVFEKKCCFRDVIKELFQDG
jgi:hypothetical protein